MAGKGGYRRRVGCGDERFYCPPAMRERDNQQQYQRYKKEQKQTHYSRNDYQGKSRGCYVGSEKRIEPDDTPTTSVSLYNLSNLDRFLQHTTPTVVAQQFPKTIRRGWRSTVNEFHPYFVLGDLWESFGEWSSYGAGVPLVLNGSDSVVQYYVPYLSAIQLYIDPSKPFVGQKRAIYESDADSSRETSSDGSTEGIFQGLNRLSLRKDRVNLLSADDCDISNPPGLLIFEYLEDEQPYGREPLADKISVLESRFSEIKTLRSCDLTPASWISVAWYPIYRIPVGPTLQNLEACFLTYHSLSTPLNCASNDRQHLYGSMMCRGVHDNDMSIGLSLPTFGLSTYKFKGSDWTCDGANECQKVSSLLHAAENWLQLLQVNHPDFSFFLSRNLYLR